MLPRTRSTKFPPPPSPPSPPRPLVTCRSSVPTADGSTRLMATAPISEKPCERTMVSRSRNKASSHLRMQRMQVLM